MRLIDADRLIELMNERDADCSEHKNAVDIGYSLAVEHMKYEIEQNNEYHCKIYDVDIKQFECKKQKTRADRIHSMSDEELAGSRVDRIDFYTKSDIPEYIGDFDGIANSIEEAIALEIKWLQSEVDG